jgi:serine/threonine-protein kinase
MKSAELDTRSGTASGDTDEASPRNRREHDQLRRAKERVGQVLREKWHLDALLGVGGMAAVYAATHRNGKRIALKMLHPELSSLDHMKQRFLDEGYAANRVGHPGAVSVLDDGVAEDGAVFLVMDLLEGETLDERLRRVEAVELTDVVRIADAVLDVLVAAHRQGVVHRDVKPDNIFMTSDGSIKLFDFGIARVSDPVRQYTTRLGETMGTPAFMPPEQARGRWNEIDGRTDLWAVGATMFFALAGRPVHDAETINEQLLSAMTREAPSVGDIVPGLPAPLVAVINRALAYEKTDRWPDASAMQTALQASRASMQAAPHVAVGGGTHAAMIIDGAPPMIFASGAGWATLDRLFGWTANRTRWLVAFAGVLAFALIWLTGFRSPATAPMSRPPVLAPEVLLPAQQVAVPRSETPTPAHAEEAASLPIPNASSPLPNASAPVTTAPGASAPPRPAASRAILPRPTAPKVSSHEPRQQPQFDPLERRK